LNRAKNPVVQVVESFEIREPPPFWQRKDSACGIYCVITGFNDGLCRFSLVIDGAVKPVGGKCRSLGEAETHQRFKTRLVYGKRFKAHVDMARGFRRVNAAKRFNKTRCRAKAYCVYRRARQSGLKPLVELNTVEIPALQGEEDVKSCYYGVTIYMLRNFSSFV
jgi:hypothetical protein